MVRGQVFQVCVCTAPMCEIVYKCCACIYVRMYGVCLCMSVYVHVYTYVQYVCVRMYIMYVCVCVSVCVCACVCLSVCVRVHVCVCECECECVSKGKHAIMIHFKVWLDHVWQEAILITISIQANFVNVDKIMVWNSNPQPLVASLIIKSLSKIINFSVLDQDAG